MLSDLDYIRESLLDTQLALAQLHLSPAAVFFVPFDIIQPVSPIVTISSLNRSAAPPNTIIWPNISQQALATAIHIIAGSY